MYGSSFGAASCPSAPCAENWFPTFMSRDYYNTTVRHELTRLGYISSENAEPEEVIEGLNCWYASKPNRNFGVACMIGGDSVLANEKMLAALRADTVQAGTTQAKPAAKASAADGGTNWLLLGGLGVAAVLVGMAFARR